MSMIWQEMRLVQINYRSSIILVEKCMHENLSCKNFHLVYRTLLSFMGPYILSGPLVAIHVALCKEELAFS